MREVAEQFLPICVHRVSSIDATVVGYAPNLTISRQGSEAKRKLYRSSTPRQRTNLWTAMPGSSVGIDTKRKFSIGCYGQLLDSLTCWQGIPSVSFKAIK